MRWRGLVLGGMCVLAGRVAALQCLNRAQEDTAERLERLVAESFVGQEAAVQLVTDALVRWVGNEGERHGPLILHLIGPSGVGKTKLAELVAESFFERRHCTENPFTKTAFGFAMPIFKAVLGQQSGRAFSVRCPGADVSSILSNVCGVLYLPFTRSDNHTEVISRFLSRRVAPHYAKHADDLMVIIIDEFNHCIGDCEDKASRMVRDGHFYADGTEFISLENAVIIFTSDLNEVGLRLVPEESRKDAMRRIKDKAREHWGPDSMWTSVGRTVGLVPLSEAELARLLDVKLKELEQYVKREVERIFHSSKRPKHHWNGKFFCPSRTRERLIASVFHSSRTKNARAVTVELWTELSKVVFEPESIGKRLLGKKCTSVSKGPPKPTFSWGSMETEVCEHTCNIILTILDEAEDGKPGEVSYQLAFEEVDG